MRGRWRRPSPPHGAALRRAALVVVGSVVVGLAACTAGSTEEAPLAAEAPPIEEPVPAPTGRAVELVLPPRSTLAAPVADGLEDRLTALGAALPEGVDALSVRSPEAAVFVPDLLELAAAGGAGLVCAIGPDVAAQADRTAVRHGGTQVCAMPAAGPIPDDGDGEDDEDVRPMPAVRIDVPIEELGLLVGTAARTAATGVAAAAVAAEEGGAEGQAGPEEDAPEDAAPEEDAPEDAAPEEDAPGEDAPAAEQPGEQERDAPPAPTPRVGLLLGGDELPASRFRAGLLEGLGPVEIIEPVSSDLVPTASDFEPVAALEEVLARGAQVVVVDGGPAADRVIDAVDGRAGVIGPADLWGAELPAGVVLTYRLRWDAVVTSVLERFASTDGFGGPVLLDVGDGVLDLRAAPGEPEVMAAVAAARAALSAVDEPRVPLPEDGPSGPLR